ncbi:MAG: DUF5301 domain-containing protein [Anaerovoracaceae bacterium]
MKKTTVAIGLILITALCLSACTKKSEPLVLPEAKDVKSIEIARGIEDLICKDQEKIDEFIQKATKAKPTDLKLHSDVRSIEGCQRVDLVTGDDMISIYVYEKDSKWYIERESQGIYETDETLLKILE